MTTKTTNPDGPLRPGQGGNSAAMQIHRLDAFLTEHFPDHRCDGEATGDAAARLLLEFLKVQGVLLAASRAMNLKMPTHRCPDQVHDRINRPMHAFTTRPRVVGAMQLWGDLSNVGFLTQALPKDRYTFMVNENGVTITDKRTKGNTRVGLNGYLVRDGADYYGMDAEDFVAAFVPLNWND